LAVAARQLTTAESVMALWEALPQGTLAMPDIEKKMRVLVLTETYRIIGEVRFLPDGGLWDFKHRSEDHLVTVYDAQFFSLADGKREYDAKIAEVNRDRVVAVFKEEDLGFMRKIQ
jgi:hypothetical protein